MKALRILLAGAVASIAAAGAANAATLSLKLTADDQFSAYLSTSDSTLGTLIGSGGSWASTFDLSTPLTGSSPYYLHIVGANSGGGPDGLLGQFDLSGGGFTFANGTTSLLTNTSNWRASDALNSSTWTAPVGAPQSFGANGVGPWGAHSAIDSNAQWIWSSPDSTAYADFSTTISAVASAAPEPGVWAMMITGLGLLGLSLRQRRQTGTARLGA